MSHVNNDETYIMEITHLSYIDFTLAREKSIIFAFKKIKFIK